MLAEQLAPAATENPDLIITSEPPTVRPKKPRRTFDQVYAAWVAKCAAMDEADAADEAATEAFEKAEKDYPFEPPPAPAILTPKVKTWIVSAEIKWSDGTTKTVAEQHDAPDASTLTNEMAIRQYFMGDPDGAKPLLAALSVWEAEKEAAMPPELVAARDAAKAACRAESAARRIAQEAAMAVFKYPISKAAQLAQKIEVQAWAMALGEEWLVNEAVVAMRRDLRRIEGNVARDGTGGAALQEAWASVRAEFERITAAYDATVDAEERLYEETFPGRPEPAEDLFLHQNGKRTRLLTPQDLQPGGEYHTAAQLLPSSIRNDLAQRITAHEKAVDRYNRDTGIIAAREASCAAGAAVNAAAERLHRTPSADLAGLLVKFEVLASWTNGIEFSKPSEVQQALTDDEDYVWVTFYRDLARLAGQPDKTAGIEPFDVAAKLAELRSIKGFEITRYGVAYLDEAWPDWVPDETFNVTDHDRLARYAQGMGVDVEKWFRENGQRGACILNAEGLRRAYADDPDEAERLVGLLERRTAGRKQRPAGEAEWRALAYWQQQAVKALAKKEAH